MLRLWYFMEVLQKVPWQGIGIGYQLSWSSAEFFCFLTLGRLIMVNIFLVPPLVVLEFKIICLCWFRYLLNSCIPIQSFQAWHHGIQQNITGPRVLFNIITGLGTHQHTDVRAASHHVAREDHGACLPKARSMRVHRWIGTGNCELEFPAWSWKTATGSCKAMRESESLIHGPLLLVFSLFCFLCLSVLKTDHKWPHSHGVCERAI